MLDDLCRRRGCLENHADMSITHRVNCPAHPDFVNRVLNPEPVASLALARAEKGQQPEECAAMDALNLARDWVARSGEEPTHVMVFIAREQEGGADGIKFFQTGTYRPHAQVGMVIEGLDIMRGSGWTEYGK